MALFKLRWLRRLVRKNTNPIPKDVALDWKAKLSIAYMLIACNAAGIVIYMCCTGRSDWPKYYGLKTEEEANKRPAIYFAELLGIKKAQIISISGMTKKEDFNYTKTTEENKTK